MRAGLATTSSTVRPAPHRSQSVVRPGCAAIVQIAEIPGHTDPNFTVRTCTHTVAGAPERRRCEDRSIPRCPAGRMGLSMRSARMITRLIRRGWAAPMHC